MSNRTTKDCWPVKGQKLRTHKMDSEDDDGCHSIRLRKEICSLKRAIRIYKTQELDIKNKLKRMEKVHNKTEQLEKKILRRKYSSERQNENAKHKAIEAELKKFCEYEELQKKIVLTEAREIKMREEEEKPKELEIGNKEKKKGKEKSVGKGKEKVKEKGKVTDKKETTKEKSKETLKSKAVIPKSKKINKGERQNSLGSKGESSGEKSENEVFEFDPWDFGFDEDTDEEVNVEEDIHAVMTKNNMEQKDDMLNAKYTSKDRDSRKRRYANDKYYFQYYIKSKVVIIDSSESSSESEEDFEVYTEKYPLTKKSKITQNYLYKQKVRKMREEKKQSIEKKRNNLRKVKKQFGNNAYSVQCHQKVRTQYKKMDEAKIADRLKKEFNIDVSLLSTSRDSVIKRYQEYEREKADLEQKKVKHRIEILTRLLAEEKEKYNDKRIHELRKYVLSTKHKRPVKKALLLGNELTKELKEDESKMTSVPDEYEEVIQLPPHAQENEWETEDEALTELEEKESKEIKTKSKKKEKEEKGKRKSKVQNKKAKGKKEKQEGEKSEDELLEDKRKEGKQKKTKGKKSKRKIEEEILPVEVPPPKREHIHPENVMFPDLMEVFKKTDYLDEDIKIVRAPPPTIEPPDSSFTWKPNVVIFKDFKHGRVYQQCIVVTNVTLQKVNCKMSQLELDDDLQRKVLEVYCCHPGTIFPGMNFKFKVIFSPEASTNDILGEVIFKTNRGPNTKVQMFSIPIQCCTKLPDAPQPKISPTELNFHAVRGWTGAVYKVIKLINNGTLGCTAHINKLERFNEATEQIVPELGNESPDEYEAKEPKTSITEQLIETDIDTSKVKNKLPKNKTKKKDKKANLENIAIESIDKDKLESISHERVTEDVDVTDNIFEVNHAESMMAAVDVLNECLDNVFEVFHFEQRYCINVLPKSFVSLKVWFGTHLPGIYQQDFLFRFEDYFHNYVSQFTASVSGEIVMFPLTVYPSLLDFQICMFDGNIYQDYFRVYNDSKFVIALHSRVPHCLQNHVEVYPKEIYAPAYSFNKFHVRLCVKWSISDDAPKYYDLETEMLSFPVHITSTNSSLGKCPVLEVTILAIMSNPHDIVLSPAICELGTVTTLETVCKTITITNNSKASQIFFFLNTPESVMIYPFCGLGTILSGQTLQLQLLYSPLPSDIEGNELEIKNGVDGDHWYSLMCVTAASHAGSGSGPWIESCRRKQIEKQRILQEYTAEVEPSEETDSTSLTSILKPNTAVSDTQKENLAYSDTIDIQQNPDAFSTKVSWNVLGNRYETSFDRLMKEGKYNKEKENENNGQRREIEEIRDINGRQELEQVVEEQEEECDDRVQRNVIRCHAYVIDPLCQLSVSKVIFPDTGCTSYSLVTFFFQTENKVTGTDCRCGFLPPIGQPKKDFYAWFDFRSNHKELTVEPQCGKVTSGEKVKITLIFRPLLQEEDVEYLARMKKAEQKREEEKKEIKNKKTQKGKELLSKKGKKKSVAKIEVEEPLNLDAVELKPCDLLSAERDILETLEPYEVNALVKCYVKTAVSTAEEEPRRLEIHRLEILCPVVRPDFVLLCDSHHIRFGPVAVGTRPKYNLTVKNINTFDIFVRLSLFNPLGPFFSRSIAKMVVREHIIKIPITYGPNEETSEVREYFEVRSENTIVHLMVSGWGVTPVFTITPEFLVYRFDPDVPEGAECTIKIKNDCEAPLSFKMEQIFVKQAVDKPQIPPEVSTKQGNDKDSEKEEKKEEGKEAKKEQKKSDKGNKKDKKDKKDKKNKKEELINRMDIELSPEEEKSLNEDFIEGDVDLRLMFSTPGMSETNELVIPPNEMVAFKVVFSIPEPSQENLGSTSRDSSKKSGKSKNSSMEKETKSMSQSPQPIQEKKGSMKSILSGSTKSKREQKIVEKPGMRYAAKYNLMLGRIVPVKEYIFIAVVKGSKGETAKGKKKGKDKGN